MSEIDQTGDALLTRQEACASLGITSGRFEFLRQRYGVVPVVQRSPLQRATVKVNLYRRADIERLRDKDIVYGKDSVRG